eukprot:Nk52_evm10s254 gene=Nk52_evmTU10s254
MCNLKGEKADQPDFQTEATYDVSPEQDASSFEVSDKNTKFCVELENDSSATETSQPNIQANIWPVLMLFVYLITERSSITAYYTVMIVFFLEMYDWDSVKSNGVAQAGQFLLNALTITVAVLSDAYLGRLRTLRMGIVSYFIGYVLTILSAFSFTWETFPYVAGNGSYALFFAGMIFLMTGNATSKSCVSIMIADQSKHYNECVTATKTGKGDEKRNKDASDSKVVEKIFRYINFIINFGCIFSLIIVPLVHRFGDKKVIMGEHNTPEEIGTSYYYSFLLCGGIYFIGALAFLSHSKHYLSDNPNKEKNSVLMILGCIRNGVSNKREAKRNVRISAVSQHEHGSSSDKASWAQFVDDKHKTVAKDIQAITHVVILFLVYFTLFATVNGAYTTALVIQTSWMSRPDWFPPEYIMVVGAIVAVTVIPLIDITMTFFQTTKISALRFKLGPQMRMTIGFVWMGIAFLYFTVLQYYVYDHGVPDSEGDFHSDVSVWYQLFFQFPFSFGLMLNNMSSLEYAYKVAPLYMKGTVTGLLQLSFALGAVVNLAYSPAVTAYGLVYILGSLSFLLFIASITHHIFFQKYDHIDKEDEENKNNEEP